MVNSVNVTWFRGLGRDAAGRWTYEDKGAMSTQALAAHQTKPAVFDWNKDGVPDLLIGAEDGFFYLLPNPRRKK